MTKITSVIFFLILLLSLSAKNVSANHSWGGYHWTRTANFFNLRLGDNLSSNWKPFLTTTSNDWSGLAKGLRTAFTNNSFENEYLKSLLFAYAN